MKNDQTYINAYKYKLVFELNIFDIAKIRPFRIICK